VQSSASLFNLQHPHLSFPAPAYVFFLVLHSHLPFPLHFSQ
jgi:hypothetical protein